MNGESWWQSTSNGLKEEFVIVNGVFTYQQ